MKWNHVFTRPSSGPNRTAFPSLDVLECIELEEIFMFLDTNFIVDHFSLYLLSALMINMWIVWFPGRLDPHKVGLSASKESKLTISHSSPHFNNNTSTVLLELQSNRSIQVNLIWKFYISLFLIRVKVFLDLPSLLIGAPKFCILVLFDQVTDCYYNVFKVY